MLVRKIENFRATLSDIFMGKSIGFPSQNEHFRHFHLGILPGLEGTVKVD